MSADAFARLRAVRRVEEIQRADLRAMLDAYEAREADHRIAEELPPEARAWFDEDLRLFGENAKRLDERSKQIAAAILTGRST